MTDNTGFDDTSGLLFVFLLALSAIVGVLTTEYLGVDGPGAVPLLVTTVIALPVLVGLLWILVMVDPYNARELLMGEQ